MSRSTIPRARAITWQGIRIMLWMKRGNSIATYAARSVFRCIIMANHDLMFQARAAMTM